MLVQPLPVNVAETVKDNRKYFRTIINEVKGGWDFLCERRFFEFYERREDILLHSERTFFMMEISYIQHSNHQSQERVRTRQQSGDAKPSHHFTRMQSLSGPVTVDSEIVGGLWLELQPVHLQLTAVLENTSLD
ncbi:unnamed protein product [Schistosoma curassoni]|uniref:DUF1016 family protein n=1 Tax=Schistosoma curassoni TaxID=6186 RepID=A0A183JIG6_9TREM|nr:unnamed protein product [Schistosoma curassoni]